MTSTDNSGQHPMDSEMKTEDEPEVMENELPDYLSYQDVVETQTDKAKEYHDINLRLELFDTVFGLILMIALVGLGFPNYLRDISPFGNEYSFMSIAFVSVIFLFTTWIIDLPISYYSETIERRFEFATRDTKKWAIDKLKELGISLLIFTLVIEALFSALHFAPTIWWIFAFLGYFVFAGLLAALSPFIISMFTKIEPLEEGEVRSTVENIAKEMNLEYDDIYHWRMSDQTTKANAAVVGFGSTIRIMLGDTLTKTFRPDEIEIVMCHEIAHQQNKDVHRGIAFSGVISLIAFILIDLSYDWAIEVFGYSSMSDPAAIGYILLAFSVILLFLGKLTLWHSRRREKAADMVAIQHIPNLEVFESAFARLSQQNLSYPNPSKLEILWRYSHPPITQRIRYAKKYYDSLEK